jgi:hypothetical protein
VWEVNTPVSYRTVSQPAKERILITNIPQQVYDLKWFMFEGIDLLTGKRGTYQYTDRNADWWHLIVSAG